MSEPITPESLSITPVRVPADAADLEAGEFDDFRISVDVRNAVDVTIRGDDSVAITPDQVLPMWKSTDEEPHGWILRTDGRVAGRAMMYLPLEEGSQRVQVRAEILPEFRRRGIGTIALAFLEERAREHGRGILQAWTEHTPRSGAVLPARPGSERCPVMQRSRC